MWMHYPTEAQIAWWRNNETQSITSALLEEMKLTGVPRNSRQEIAGQHAKEWNEREKSGGGKRKGAVPKPHLPPPSWRWAFVVLPLWCRRKDLSGAEIHRTQHFGQSEWGDRADGHGGYEHRVLRCYGCRSSGRAVQAVGDWAPVCMAGDRRGRTGGGVWSARRRRAAHRSVAVLSTLTSPGSRKWGIQSFICAISLN
jgi:hypothetical protein